MVERRRPRRRKAVLTSSSGDEEPCKKSGADVPLKGLDWSFDFDAGHHEPTVSSKRPRLATTTFKSSSFDKIYTRNIDYEELALHEKKIDQIEQWFLTVKNSSKSGLEKAPVLLVTGPAGSGKTSCIRAVAKKHFFQIINGYEYVKERKHKRPQNLSFAPLKLIEEDRSSYSLVFKAILFDDLPQADFGNEFEHFVTDNSSDAMILVATEPCGEDRTFSDDHVLRRIAKQPNTTHISFNPIAASFLKKISSESHAPTHGDARAMLIDQAMGVTESQRDCSFHFFHTVGKVLYGKMEFDASVLTDSDRQLFQGFLHANYTKHFDDLNAIQQISESFSWMDAMDWRITIDSHWSSTFAALPETLIMHYAAKGSKKKSFAPIEAPHRHYLS